MKGFREWQMQDLVLGASGSLEAGPPAGEHGGEPPEAEDLMHSESW